MEVKFNPNQLKKARLMRGYTMLELAAKSSLSRESISKYEMGATVPRSDSIIKLANALNFPENFFGKSDQKVPMGTVFFRSQASSTNKARQMQKTRLDFAAQCLDLIMEYLKIPELTIPEPLNLNVEDITDKIINQTAAKVRQMWKLGQGPIGNLTNVMEANGIIVVETTMHNEQMDAVSTWIKGEPLIALTDNNESVMRRRFNLAHELGHLLLHAGVENIFELNNNVYKNKLEKQANQFASNLLLPENSYRDYLISTGMPFFQKAKSYWNVSIATLIYRANELQLLSENQYLYLQKQISRNHWRKHEPGDDQLPQEHPVIFKQALKMIVDANLLSKQEVANILGLPVEELEAFFRTSFKPAETNLNLKPHLHIIK